MESTEKKKNFFQEQNWNWCSKQKFFWWGPRILFYKHENSFAKVYTKQTHYIFLFLISNYTSIQYILNPSFVFILTTTRLNNKQSLKIIIIIISLKAGQLCLNLNKYPIQGLRSHAIPAWPAIYLKGWD